MWNPGLLHWPWILWGATLPQLDGKCEYAWKDSLDIVKWECWAIILLRPPDCLPRPKISWLPAWSQANPGKQEIMEPSQLLKVPRDKYTESGGEERAVWPMRVCRGDASYHSGSLGFSLPSDSQPRALSVFSPCLSVWSLQEEIMRLQWKLTTWELDCPVVSPALHHYLKTTEGWNYRFYQEAFPIK